VPAFPSYIGRRRPDLRQSSCIHSTSSADIRAPTLAGRTLDPRWKAPGTNSRSRGWGDKHDQCLKFSVGAGTCRGMSRGWKGSVDKRDRMSWSAAWISSSAPRHQDSGRRWTNSGDRHAPRPLQRRWRMRVSREAREQSAFSLPVSCHGMCEDVRARNSMCERRCRFP
jgi:hypothetical protein